MKYLIAIIFSLFVFSNLEAQHIYMHKKESTWVKKVRNKQHVMIKTESGKLFMGRVFLVNDSTVAIKRNFIKLSEIESITKRPLVQYIYSALAAGVGAWFIAEGLSSNDEGGAIVYVFGILFLTEGIGTGIIPHMRHYSENWTYEISMQN